MLLHVHTPMHVVRCYMYTLPCMWYILHVHTHMHVVGRCGVRIDHISSNKMSWWWFGIITGFFIYTRTGSRRDTVLRKIVGVDPSLLYKGCFIHRVLRHIVGIKPGGIENVFDAEMTPSFPGFPTRGSLGTRLAILTIQLSIIAEMTLIPRLPHSWKPGNEASHTYDPVEYRC